MKTENKDYQLIDLTTGLVIFEGSKGECEAQLSYTCGAAGCKRADEPLQDEDGKYNYWTK